MCNCIKKLNEQLKADGRNTFIVEPFLIDRQTGQVKEPKAIIETDKIDPRKKELKMKFFATYCPFCGVKYE